MNLCKDIKIAIQSGHKWNAPSFQSLHFLHKSPVTMFGKVFAGGNYNNNNNNINNNNYNGTWSWDNNGQWQDIDTIASKQIDDELRDQWKKGRR